MLKNTIKKFAAFGLAMVLCVPAFLASAQEQEKTYSKEELPGLIEKASREKNYFVIDMVRSTIEAELSGEIPRLLTEGMDEELIDMFLGHSAEEIVKMFLAEAESREEAFLLALGQMPPVHEDESFVTFPYFHLVDGLLSEVYGECYRK